MKPIRRQGVLALALAGGLSVASLAGYRILTRDYRYFHLVKLGDDLMAEGLPFQATRAYGTAIRAKPADPMAYIKRAAAQRKQGNLSPAIEDLEAASRRSTDRIQISLRLADLYYEAERFDEAARHYEEVSALDPGEASVLYKLALVRFRAGREAAAIEALNRAAAIREGFWEAYYLRGAIFRALGATDEAAADFRRALELHPEAKPARKTLIDLYLENSEPGKAMELVQTELDENPEAPEPYLHLADVHRLEGRQEEALEAVGLALEQDPNLPEAYLALGELWLEEATRRGDTVSADKAVAALESAVKMNPSSGRAALELGRAYLVVGEEARGFAELQRASEATPVQAEAHRLLGDLYRARDNDAEAVTAYHVFLRLRGDSPAVLDRLGDTYTDLGNPSQAAEIYSRLAALEPRRITPLVKTARALLEAGKSVSAASVCRRGLATNPENPTLLALLDEARGRTTP